MRYPAAKKISHIHSSVAIIPKSAPYPKPTSPIQLSIMNDEIRIQWVYAKSPFLTLQRIRIAGTNNILSKIGFRA